MFRLFKNFSKKDYVFILICLVLIVIHVWLELKMPDYMSAITRLVQTDGSTMRDILKQGAYMLSCAIGGLLSAIVVGYFSTQVASSFSATLRRKIFEKVQMFSIQEIKKFSTSSLITRTTNDVTQIEMLIGMGLQVMAKAPIMAVWAILKILNKGFEWSMLVLVCVVILLLTVGTIMIIVLPRFAKVQKLIDRINGVTRENLNGIRVIRAFNAEKYQEERFGEVNSELTGMQLFNQRCFSIMMPVMNIIMHGLTLGIYLIGAYLINGALMSDKITLFSNMVVFSSYGMQVIASFLMLSMTFMMWPRSSVSAKRINEVLDEKVSITDGTFSGNTSLKGVVEFKNVSFKYPDADEYLLKDISFKVNQGETIAFIGSTGSGKSTLINLIPRFYDVSSGEVLVDGVNVKDYTSEVLNKKLGYIPQKAVMFTGSVVDNVSYGDSGKDISEDDIKKAIEVAQGKDFVEKMDGQYNAHIARGGTNVSGGQKQRLAIARAIAREPEIYIFDDSFSALDYKTDAILRKELKKYTKDATSIIVAQRIGTIINADKIVVLDNGECVGIGTHKELLKKCEVYKEIALSQLQEEELNNAYTIGRGPGGLSMEKSKDFKGSMIRLLNNLKPWRVLLYLSLVLAMISAILALVSPGKLSDLTDTITLGISPDSKILETVSLEMMDSFSEEKLKEKIPLIISSPSISKEDIKLFNETMDRISKLDNKEEAMSIMLGLSDSILGMLLEEFEIKGVVISIDDQLKVMDIANRMNMESTKDLSLLDELPNSIYGLVKPSIDIDKVLEISLIIGILYITSAVLNYIQNFSMTTISNKFAKMLRTNISKKINLLPLKYFDTHETGDVLSRITNDVDMIAHNLNQSLVTLVTSITLFIGSIVMMFYTNGWMAITAIISSLIGFVLMFLILGKSQKYFTRRQEVLGDLNGYIEEMYSGHNVVKVYNGTKRAIKDFNDLNKKLYDANRKSQFLSGLMHPIMAFVGNFGYVMVCIVGALLVSNGSITFGVIIAFMIYVRLFNNPLTQMAQAMTNLQSTVAASERVFEFLDEKEMSSQKEIKKHLSKSKIKGKIEFKNVKFGYDFGKVVIKDFSVTVKPGQKVAIVGPTGAGKTTMVNLLMKFYEINDGDILIDGVSIKELSRENVHDLFCMVLQDTWLFEGTIGENIRFNKQNITDEEVWSVCRTVGVDHFVKTLPGGLDAMLGDNDTVSSGQKQLFTIARGMLEDAPFLILDEATSNVDTRTEELVQKAMDKLTEGRTSFIIAHRLSTIKNADLILVMKDGNIIETGNHNELMKQNGFYAELYNSQFEI